MGNKGKIAKNQSDKIDVHICSEFRFRETSTVNGETQLRFDSIELSNSLWYYQSNEDVIFAACLKSTFSLSLEIEWRSRERKRRKSAGKEKIIGEEI